MSNNVLTLNKIAKEALMRLYAHLHGAALVHRDFSADFDGKQGNTVTIRKPAVFEAKEFAGSIERQDINEGSTTVTLDQHIDISVGVTSKEWTLDIADFGEQVAGPAMEAIAQDIDKRILQLARTIPHTVGTPGTTPSAIADITGARKSLNRRNVPNSGRSLLIDPEAADNFLQLETFHSAEKVGSTAGLIEASLGRKFGFDIYESNNLDTAENGVVNGADDLGVVGGAAAGATSLVIGSVDGATGTVNAGQVLTVDGVTYTAQADADFAADQATVSVLPAVPADIADGAAVTVTAADVVSNVAFHRTAFALVSRTLELPAGVGAGQAAVESYKGLGIRVVRDYDISSKSDTISFDVLIGTKVLDADRAVRLFG